MVAMNENNCTEKFFPNTRKLAKAHLKRCPLCNALNSATNEECFVCRWHGDFCHDQKMIEEGLASLLRRCPEYRYQEPSLPRYPAEGRNKKWRFLLRRLMHGPLDYRV